MTCPDDPEDGQCGGLFKIPTGIKRPNDSDPTQHLTIVFNTFVFMTLFNWINCRKLYHEFNAFSGIQNNPMFCGIWILCAILQVILVEAGSFTADSDYEL